MSDHRVRRLERWNVALLGMVLTPMWMGSILAVAEKPLAIPSGDVAVGPLEDGPKT